MPLINGQKMACVPCIRGHRSTKCNHAEERVMVPVRKPGRPLSACPCAPGRPCSCGGVKVAIPRRQKCHCGPGPEAAPGEVKSELPTCEPETSVSPTRSAYRVQKPGVTSRQNGNRKQSFDLANLDRIDLTSVNILNGYPSLDTGSPPVPGSIAPPIEARVEVGSADGLVSLPADAYRGYHASYGGPADYMTTAPPGARQRQAAPAPASHALQAGETGPAALASGGCCGPSGSPAPEANGSASQSCCSGPKDDPVGSEAAMMLSQQMIQSNGAPAALLRPQGHVEHQQISIPYTQPNIYVYPEDYGSWSHPVNQAIWAQLQDSQLQNLQATALPNTETTTMAANPVAATSHQCDCGPGCQCVGCLAHPFNDEMLQYVGGAWDHDTNTPPTEVHVNRRDPAVKSNGHAAGVLGGDDRRDSSAAGIANGQNKNLDPEEDAPSRAPTPSDASASSDEQALSTSDYFFVNLPLFPGVETGGEACGGNMTLCPCGEYCQCDGCLVHNTRLLER